MKSVRDHRYTSAMSVPSLRLFVAVHLPEPVRAALAGTASSLRGALPNVRWVRDDILHLTLVFLGERPAVQVEAIIAAMEPACKERVAFMLAGGVNGCFPSAERARVLWTGLSGDVAALIALRGALVTALAAANLLGQGERFSPHLTIGRLRDGIPSSARTDAGRSWMDLAPLPGVPIPVTGIHLMRSTLAPGGPHYTTLRTISLAKAG